MSKTSTSPPSAYEVHWTAKESAELIRLYHDQPLVADRLPWTAEFETLYHTFCRRTGKAVSRHHVQMHLIDLRKDSKLPDKGRKRVEPAWWN